MNIYKELQIPVTDNNLKDILVAQLSQLGFEGFEEERNLLKAFIPATAFDQVSVIAFLQQEELAFTINDLEDRNWNADWERNFQPVQVGKFCAIRASFHAPLPGFKHDIIITPKMSFGTGHHATTYLMVQAMEALNIAQKAVFDYGTGTGILSILAEKLGASTITAIDNDPWSIENSIENIEANNCHKILIVNSEKFLSNKLFDVILANINRNIILQNLASMKQHLAPAGVLLLSGLLADDQSIILEEAAKYALQLSVRYEKDGWICLQLINE